MLNISENTFFAISHEADKKLEMQVCLRFRSFLVTWMLNNVYISLAVLLCSHCQPRDENYRQDLIDKGLKMNVKKSILTVLFFKQSLPHY